MKIAVPMEHDEIYQHFGKTKAFRVYDVDKSGRIIGYQDVPTKGTEHGALPVFLHELDVSVVICGGLGMPMYNGLIGFDMQVYGGVSGDCNTAVQDYLDGNLDYDPQAAEKHGNCQSEQKQMLS